MEEMQFTWEIILVADGSVLGWQE